MSLKEKFNEIEEQVNLLMDLANKQTEDFEEGLELIYKLSVINKLFSSLDPKSKDATEIRLMIDQIKGALLLEEEN